MRLHELVKRLLLLLFSAVLGIGLAELAARILFAREFGDVLTLDDTLLYRPVPGAVKYHHLSTANGERRVEVRYNAQGFRGPALRPAGSALRVAVYGDSFIDAYYAEEPATFCARLEVHLTTALDRPVEVVNAGVRGYGPDQVALKLEQELPTLRPDLVLVAFYAGNDFGDVVRDQLFGFDASGALVRRAARPGARYVEEFQSTQRGPFLLRALSRVRDARDREVMTAGADPDSLAAGQVRRWLDDAAREWRASTGRGTGEAAIFHDGEDVDIAVDPASETARHKVRLTAAVLRHLEHVAATAGTKLAYVVIPPPGDLIPDYDVYHVDARVFADYSPAHLHEAALAVLQPGGAPIVDLHGPFTAHGPASLFLHADDMHWSPQGQDLAARIVADSVAARGLLER
jgi:lysophospholipase L1-like esterase